MTARNIIICCDGTGNEISENIYNVLKLYRCLRKTEKTEPRQLVSFDTGVGTLEDAFVHVSVVKRMDAIRDYRPVNLPTRFQTFPMPAAAEG